MQSATALGKIASDLLGTVNLSLSSCVSLQSLWAGYGQIVHLLAMPQHLEAERICTTNTQPQSLILKYVTPPSKSKHSETSVLDEGYIRKILSYQIERYFYINLAPLMPKSISVATCIASSNGDAEATAMIMTDLRQSFPLAGEKRAQLSKVQTFAALEWLANFHGFWWTQVGDFDKGTCIRPPLVHYATHQNTALLGRGNVWLNGGYTYLATRGKEFQDLRFDSDSEWSPALCDAVLPGNINIAEAVAIALSSDTTASLQPYLTLIHGDIKSENLFTSPDGKSVAFYDFQYVGLGYGVSDLAKFFTCSVPLHMLIDDTSQTYSTTSLEMQSGEINLLRLYLLEIQKRSNKIYPWEVFVRHWETALVDWLRFQASWGFWGNTEWLESRVRSILKDDHWKQWLKQTIEDA